MLVDPLPKNKIQPTEVIGNSSCPLRPRVNPPAAGVSEPSGSKSSTSGSDREPARGGSGRGRSRRDLRHFKTLCESPAVRAKLLQKGPAARWQGLKIIYEIILSNNYLNNVINDFISLARAEIFLSKAPDLGWFRQGQNPYETSQNP